MNIRSTTQTGNTSDETGGDSSDVTGTERFDHIVIGAGSAGCAVVRRLVDAGRRVALVEAGGPVADDRITDITRMWELWGLPTDWQFKSEPMKHSSDTVVELPRGKVLGGSSAMYGLVHARGVRVDYDAWAHSGAPGWSWDDVLPVYRRLEDFEGGADDYRGVGGPMPVSLNHDPNRLTHKFVAAGVQAGLVKNPDYNGADPEGIAVAQINARDGHRVTSWDAYLAPIQDDARFTLFDRSLALRLTFDDHRCTGVVIERDGEEIELRAAGDVILSAGSYQSPQLLMLSGIGDREELERHGIDTRAHLPGVGRNLQDHFLVPIIFDSKNPIEPQRANGTECHFFAKSNPELGAPDLQPILVAKGLPLRGDVGKVPEQSFTFLAGVIRPFSVGRVFLDSADPHRPPRIDLNYFSDPEDMRTMVAAIGMCRTIADQQALADERGRERFPGEGVTGKALEQYIREQVLTYHHPSGTCKMGRDAASVVDPRLRVRGVAGLRVADCSVFPFVPSGNTHAPAVMVGERAADFVIEDDRNLDDQNLDDQDLDRR